MVRLLLALAAMILLPVLAVAKGAPAGVAQTPPIFTCPPADGAGRTIDLKAPLDEPARLGVGYALMIGVASDDKNWPHSKLGAEAGCDIGAFKVGDTPWAVDAGADAGLPRWAQPGSGADLAFLARAPSIAQGYAFSQAQQKPMMMSLGAPMYALVVERDHLRSIYRLYDAVPPTGTLIADMGASVRGALAPIATLDPDSGALSFVVATQSPRRAIIPGLAPGKGGAAARLQAPDGDMFVEAPGNAVRMAKSRFLCPAATLAFNRKDLWVGNATDEAQDLSCSFVGATGRISVSVTRHMDRPPAKSTYDDGLEAVKTSSAVASPAPPPLGAGDPPSPRFAAAWTDKDNQRQAFWLATVGDWYIEVLATYAPAASDAIGKSVGQLYKDAFREIPAR